ncbi:MAG: hypothetical protein J6M48_06400 [Ruminococcus sp.]|nr:hypothetical protein [Ruminococcus sp.]
MLGLSGIVRIFEEIEQRLVQSLRRNLSRHKEEEEQEEKQWSAWQAEKLRSLEKFRRENAEIMAEYTEQIDQETRQIMEEEFSQGVNSVDVPPAVPVEDAPAEIHPEPQFFGVDRTKVDKLIEDVTTLEKNAETAALRLTDDVYRQTVNRVQLAMSTGSMTLQQAIDIAVKDFLDQGINCIVYRDGRRVNIADYVRMALRTTATRAALQGKSAKFKALGYDTVQVSSYGMCSKTCEPWQGRIYIEDTFSMWDGEVQEYPDGILWGKSGYCGKWFPLLSSAIEKGLFHPNCRHTILLWRDGDPLPESVDNSDSERRYKLEQQQRALEREIRKAKRKVNGFTDPENVKKAKAELRQAQKELKDFIDKVNADEGEIVLRRDEGKEKVYEGEVKPEYKTEPPVSDAPVSEGKAVEVTVSEPEKAEGAYTDEKIPKSDSPNLAKQFEPFNVDIVPSTTDITPEALEEELNKSEVGKEVLQYIEDTEIRPKLIYEPQQHDNRGQQWGNSIEIYVDNIRSPLVAAQTVIHEITHHKYGIGKCQWAEAVCMAKEKMHKENRTYLTIAEKRYIVGLAKKFYGEYNWKKGGTRYGRPL